LRTEDWAKVRAFTFPLTGNPGQHPRIRSHDSFGQPGWSFSLGPGPAQIRKIRLSTLGAFPEMSACWRLPHASAGTASAVTPPKPRLLGI